MAFVSEANEHGAFDFPTHEFLYSPGLIDRTDRCLVGSRADIEGQSRHDQNVDKDETDG